MAVADFEAGLGTLSRMKPNQLDVLLVIAEPTAKSVEVARRAVEIIRDRNVSQVKVIANRVAGEEDRLLLERAFTAGSVTMVPDDPTIRAADARGVAPFDAAAHAPAVQVLRRLAESLVS